MKNKIVIKSDNKKHEQPIEKYLEIIKNNDKKHFGFVTTHYRNSVEKCILYFSDKISNDDKQKKILIITFSNNAGLFAKFIESSKVINDSMLMFNPSLYFLKWIDFETLNFFDFSDFDYVFWDLPDLNFLKKNEIKIATSIKNIEECFLLVQGNDFKNFKKISDDVSLYFKEHGLNININ